MAVALASSASGNNSTTVSWGGSASAGDLLMVVAGSSGGGDSPATPPTGWTELYDSAFDSGSDSLFLWYKVAAGGETSVSIDTSSAWTVWVGLRFTGADQTTPIDATGTNSGSGATLTYPSVTTTSDNCLILRVGWDGFGSTSWTPGGSLIHVADPSDITGDDIGVGVDYDFSLLSPAGASGTASATIDSSSVWESATIAIAPPSSVTNAPTPSRRVLNSTPQPLFVW